MALARCQSFGPYDNFSYKHNFSGDLTWIRGNHSFKFGAIYGYYRKNENALSAADSNEGTYSGFLNTIPTSVVQASVLAPQIAGQDNNATRRTSFQSLGQLPDGQQCDFQQARFDYTGRPAAVRGEGYGQDEWRFRPNITFVLRRSLFLLRGAL